MRKINILSISDIHFGAFDSEILFYELEEVFFKYIENTPDIDLITINGDYYDEKLSMNSKDALLSIVFMKKLLRIASERNIIVRIIKGTKSHDNDQLKVLELLKDEMSSSVDFAIIYNVCEEQLFEDFKVLYIPEEYVTDVNEYYKDFLYSGKVYDMIFMHGMVTDAAFVSKEQESEITHTKAPTFDTNELLNVSTLVSSGHIHKKMQIKSDFFYTSSFSRWMHGEEEDKGFFHFVYTPIEKDYDYKFIVNKKAREFVTINIGIDDKVFDTNIEKTLENIMSICQETSSAYQIKLKVNIPSEYEQVNLLIDSLKEIFNKYKHVKLEVKNEKVIKQEEEMQEKINLLMDKYGYIFNKALPYEEKIQLYIKERYGKDIELDTIKSCIYKS